MAQKILRPLDFGGLLDEMFDLYKGNFLLFLGIAALINLPLNLILYAIFGEDRGGLIILFAGLPVNFITIAASTWAISQTYLGNTATILGSYNAIKRKAIPFIGSMLLPTILIYAGFMLCVIPGIIFTIWYSFVSEVIILEGLFWGDARRRSRELASGEWGRVFLLIVLTWIITLALTMAFTESLGLFFAETASAGKLYNMLYGLGSGLASALGTPVSTIAFVLLYYDIRVRKEGFDIEMLARSLAPETPIPGTEEAEPVQP